MLKPVSFPCMFTTAFASSTSLIHSFRNNTDMQWMQETALLECRRLVASSPFHSPLGRYHGSAATGCTVICHRLPLVRFTGSEITLCPECRAVKQAIRGGVVQDWTGAGQTETFGARVLFRIRYLAIYRADFVQYHTGFVHKHCRRHSSSSLRVLFSDFFEPIT